jgi:hypothetical protein
LRLPAELRMRVYEFIFMGTTAHLVSNQYRLLNDEVRRVPTSEYRGTLAMLYTCRQINHEASALPAKLMTFDLTCFSYADSASRLLGLERSETIKSIVLSLTRWYMAGAENSNGDSVHYGMGLFPSLMCVEIKKNGCVLKYDLVASRKALRFCFSRPELEVREC